MNTLTILGQLFITGRLLKWFGVGFTLAFLPVLSMFGFLGMGLMPVLGLLAVFQVLRRAGNFAVTRPAREVLFTVLRREDKYKAKSFIDTFVYRAGDQIGAWSYPLLTWLGLGLTGISFVAAPFAAIWCGLSIWLGKKQAALAEVGGAFAPRCPTAPRLIGAQPLPHSLDFVRFAQAPAGLGDEDIFQGWLGQGNRIDLARECLHQSRDEAGAFRLLDPHFVVQDADLHA